MLSTCGTVRAIHWRSSSDNELGGEGAVTLAPELGKLTQLQTLNLGGKRPTDFVMLCGPPV